MKNNILIALGVAIIAGSASFWGGMKYAQSRSPFGSGAFQNLTAQQRSQFQQLRGSRNGPGGTTRPDGGLVGGEILSKDAQSITVKMRDGGSKIVFYSNATVVTKPVSASVTDLAQGEQITVNGTANADGSITAQSIQVREMGPSPSPSVQP